MMWCLLFKRRVGVVRKGTSKRSVVIVDRIVTITCDDVGNIMKVTGPRKVVL